ncbi:MAG TPA: Gfo/Idh/MocA family oxidoreductase [Pyrinomonadaceae bacterium]|nr:Gfo/Idh/MocA family oxidoreductase [Pyrinomonadaceae bacterium]
MKVAVIGAGNIAEKHLEVLQAFSDVKLAAICSRGHPRIDALADRFGIPEKFTDYRTMLDTVSVDAVFVLVSAMQIVPVTAECLKRGIPTLLEKPPGLTATETESLAHIAHETNCINMVALNRRFYSVMQRAREEILKAGPLVSVLVEGPERLGEVKAVGIHPPEIIAGLLFANSIHCIDLLRYFGGDIEHIAAAASQWDEEQKNSFGALIKFESGATGHYIAHWMSPASWAVTLYGIGRRISLNPLEKATLIDSDRSETLLPVDEVDLKFKPGLYAQNRFFLDAVKECRPIAYPGSDLADAVKTMRLIEAISGGDTW